MRVGKWKCFYGQSNFGQMHVTTHYVCFAGSAAALAGGKKLMIDLKTVKSLKKAKRFFMSIGPGHSLHITDGKTTHEFHGIGERDTCLKVILGQCANLNNKPAVIEEGK